MGLKKINDIVSNISEDLIEDSIITECMNLDEGISPQIEDMIVNDMAVYLKNITDPRNRSEYTGFKNSLIYFLSSTKMKEMENKAMERANASKA